MRISFRPGGTIFGTQSLFEPSFKRDVDEIDGSLARMILQQALRKHLQGDAGAVRALARDVGRALEERMRAAR